jgi:signal peptidase I
MKYAATVFFVLLVLAAVLIIAGYLVGGRVETVLSGSMEPTIPTGGVVLISPISTGDIRVGDIIAFYNTNMKVCHRVIAIEEGPPLQFITKGDNNRAADISPVPPENVLGRVVFTIPLAGYAIYYIKTPIGLGLIILAIALLLIGSGLKTTIQEKTKRKGPKEPR